MMTKPGTFCPAIVTMKSGSPRLTITSASNCGSTGTSTGARVVAESQPVPAWTRITVTATTIAAGTAHRGAQRRSMSHTTTMGSASSGYSMTAVTGARQMGSRMPASIALASGVGMRVTARPRAGHRPHKKMRTPQTMNAPTAVSILTPPPPAAISTAAPGVDQTIEIGCRYRHESSTVKMPDVTHSASSPDAAWESLAPTASNPAMTSGNELAKPLSEATIPVDTG